MSGIFYSNHDFPLALSYDDILLVPQYSEIDSRSEVDLTTKVAEGVELKIPLVSTKMDTVTGVEMAIKMGQLGGMGILPRFDKEEVQAGKVSEVAKTGVIVAAAVGCKNGFLERAEMLVKAGAFVINIDVAHGHMRQNIEATRKLREHFGKKLVIISGIASTYECAADLYEAGADCLLVGIGAGSICTTRIQTGCGVPGFTSLLEVAIAAKKYKRTFMPDAGIRNSGDIVKALATGACGVVAGSLFAGTDEAPGEIVEVNGGSYKRYNGSASESEKRRQVERDEKGKDKMYIKHVEGVESLVSCKGPVEELVTRLTAGVRSGMAYCGARNLAELVSKARFIRVTNAGARENGAHDVLVVRKD